MNTFTSLNRLSTSASLPRPDRRHERRGVSSVLAMLFLVLFSTLAIGFYGAATMSAQVSKSDRALNQAKAAADGGMEFVRYHLGQIRAIIYLTQHTLLLVSGSFLALAKRLLNQRFAIRVSRPCQSWQ